MDVKTYPVTHTDAEWRKILSPEQYEVMREHGTERPGSCALNFEKRAGTFTCAGCGQKLFVFEEEIRERHRLAELQRPGKGLGRGIVGIAATAWCAPRCIAAAAAAISAMCFRDGPPPTHQRYCINGVAMNFQPD